MMATADSQPPTPAAQGQSTLTYIQALAICTATIKSTNLANVQPIAHLSASAVIALLQKVQAVYHSIGRSEIDPKFGALAALVGSEALKANPTYTEKVLSKDAQLLVEVVNAAVLSELQRIFGPDTVRSFAASDQDASSKIVGLIYTEPDPTVAGIYATLTQRYCTATASTLAEIDARIREPLNTSSAQAASGALVRRAAYYKERAQIFGAPVGDTEQVLTTQAEMRAKAEFEFYVSFLSAQATARTDPWKPQTLQELADAFSKFIKDDPRTEERMVALSTAGHGNVAMRADTTTASPGAHVQTGTGGGKDRRRAGSTSREPSPSATRRTNAPLIITDREKARRQLKIDRDELIRTAPGLCCKSCFGDGHTTKYCPVVHKILDLPLPSAPPPQDARPPTPPRAGRGGRRGHRN